MYLFFAWIRHHHTVTDTSDVENENECIYAEGTCVQVCRLEKWYEFAMYMLK